MNKLSETGEIMKDENGNEIMVQEWKHVAGAGFTTKKASELSYSNYVSAVAFGRATVLKKQEENNKQLQWTLGLTAITLVAVVVVGVLVFTHDAKLDTFIEFVQGYKGVVDTALASVGSSITAS